MMLQPAGTAPAAAEPAAPRYDGVAMALHWTTALLVAALYALAQAWDFAQRGGWLRHEMQAVHVSLGLLLIAVLTARIVWRAGPARRLPPAGAGKLRHAATGLHHLFYLLLAAVAVLGVTLRWGHHDPLSLFGLFTIPAPIAPGRALTRQIGGLHNWLATGIVILAGVHAAAALFHHFVLRDGALRRMLPGRAGPAGGGPGMPAGAGD